MSSVYSPTGILLPSTNQWNHQGNQQGLVVNKHTGQKHKLNPEDAPSSDSGSKMIKEEKIESPTKKRKTESEASGSTDQTCLMEFIKFIKKTDIGVMFLRYIKERHQREFREDCIKLLKIDKSAFNNPEMILHLYGRYLLMYTQAGLQLQNRTIRLYLSTLNRQFERYRRGDFGIAYEQQVIESITTEHTQQKQSVSQAHSSVHKDSSSHRTTKQKDQRSSKKKEKEDHQEQVHAIMYWHLFKAHFEQVYAQCLKLKSEYCNDCSIESFLEGVKELHMTDDADDQGRPLLKWDFVSNGPRIDHPMICDQFRHLIEQSIPQSFWVSCRKDQQLAYDYCFQTSFPWNNQQDTA